MNLPATIATCAGLFALAVTAGWLGARPPNLRRGPRMVPWRFVMLLATAALLGALTWLVSLLGLTTPR
jgi:hypothetical protein